MKKILYTMILHVTWFCWVVDLTTKLTIKVRNKIVFVLQIANKQIKHFQTPIMSTVEIC